MDEKKKRQRQRHKEREDDAKAKKHGAINAYDTEAARKARRRRELRGMSEPPNERGRVMGLDGGLADLIVKLLNDNNATRDQAARAITLALDAVILSADAFSGEPMPWPLIERLESIVDGMKKKHSTPRPPPSRR